MFSEDNTSHYKSHLNKNHSEISPIIPHIQSHAYEEFGAVLTGIKLDSEVSQGRLDKSHWICDYSDDIFQTLRETELKRQSIWFRSKQLEYRPMLLQLLKDAAEKHKLIRTTLHLAVYLLDCFMDTYTIRSDKLNLTAVTCLIVAAKMEEADMDMPKFSDINKLLDNAYSLLEFKNVEYKVLSTFDFHLIRPTVASFAEYFASSFITLQDYHIFVHHWNNEFAINQYHHFNQQIQESKQHNRNLEYASSNSHSVINSSCPYSSYEDMLTTLSKTFFALIDVSLNYFKFANSRPSIIASSCIAAVRQMYGIFPIWTPYLIKLTECSADIISPFVEAITTIYRLHCNNERLQYLQTPNTPISNNSPTSTNVLCDSPDSGIVSGNDTKSMKSDTDIDDCENIGDNADEEEDEAYLCLEYPLLPKRRRLF